MKKNLFISFEGIDGSGKDTQLFNLIKEIKNDNSSFLGDKFSNIWFTREPTDITFSGKKIASLIREKQVSGEVASKLYIKDRIEHTKIIKEVLKHSFVLISRYDVSTLVYQGVQLGNLEELYQMHNFDKKDGCIFPDVTIIFDLPAKIAFERLNKRGEVEECFEKLDFLEKARDKTFEVVDFLKKKGRKIIIVDASNSINEVFEEMIFKLKELNF